MPPVYVTTILKIGDPVDLVDAIDYTATPWWIEAARSMCEEVSDRRFRWEIIVAELTGDPGIANVVMKSSRTATSNFLVFRRKARAFQYARSERTAYSLDMKYRRAPLYCVARKQQVQFT